MVRFGRTLTAISCPGFPTGQRLHSNVWTLWQALMMGFCFMPSIQELIEAIDFDLREHDRNVAVLTIDELGSYRRKITGLAAHVLELAGISPDDLPLLFDDDGDHPFTSVDGSLPFSAGRFYWSRGTLECSLEMRKGRCWIDGRRAILSHPSNLPATTLSSCVGRRLNTLLRIEGLEFEAIIRGVHAKRDCIVLEIEMSMNEFPGQIDER